MILTREFFSWQILQSLKTTEHTQQVGDATSQAVAQQVASPILQQVKHEVDKALGPAVQAARPLQLPAMTPFPNFPARPPTLPTPHTVGGQVNPGLPSQVEAFDNMLCMGLLYRFIFYILEYI